MHLPAPILSGMPAPESIAVFAVAALALLVVPGPAVLYIVARSVDQGRPAGLVSTLGVALGSLVHVVAAAAGLSAVLAASATAFTVVKLAGAAYLIALGIRRILRPESIAVGSGRPERSLGRTFRQGVVVNILNPKIIAFFVTFLPQFVSVSDPDAAAKLLFLGAWFMVAASLVILPMIFFADLIALQLRKSPFLLRAVDWLFAGVMAGCAVRLALMRVD